MKFLSFLIFLFSISSLQAQYKAEKERAIKIAEVPKAAIDFMDSLSLRGQLKWYEEEGLEQITYEAKGKFKKQKLSVEFSNTGEFEDIEFEIKEKDIFNKALETIEKYLTQELAQHKIKKVQIQIRAKAEQIKALLESGSYQDATDLNYELIVSARNEGKYDRYEYLFDQKGEFIQKLQLVDKMDDNLVY